MCRLLPRAIDGRRRIYASRYVLRRRIVVIVDFDPLLPELLDFLPRQISGSPVDAGHCIMLAPAFSVVGGGSRYGLLTCLALKGRRGGLIHLEVLLHDVELPPIVNLGDANQVAVLVPSCNAPLSLAGDKDTGETALVVLGPLVPDRLAWMKEARHCGA
jgi:hypothetical protein